MRETTRHAPAEESFVGDHHPCTYGEGWIGSADQGGISAKLSVSPGISSSKSTRTRTPARPATNDSTALLPGGSSLSTSRLAPNRRRSYSEVSCLSFSNPSSKTPHFFSFHIRRLKLVLIQFYFFAAERVCTIPTTWVRGDPATHTCELP